MTETWPESGELAELVAQAVAGRAARDLTHEINDLLVGVVSVAEDALQAGGSARLREGLQTAAEHGRRIAELVRAFQALFSRSGETPAAGLVDVAAGIDRVLLLCRKQFVRRGIELAKRIGSLPGVRADIAPLEQTLMLLLQHGLEATPGGGMLQVTANHEGEFVVVTVSAEPQGDAEPCGPASSRAPQVDVGQPLRPFLCAEANGGGWGTPDMFRSEWPARDLGLAVLRDRIRRSGGELTASSTPGKCSRFTVRLPIHTGDTGAERPSETSQSPHMPC